MNKLEHIAEFQQVLANYQPSESAKKVISDTRFVVLTSVSSAGRNTMIRELMKQHKYHFVVSDTTRKPRVNDGILEQNGREYWFKSETDFLNGLKKGEYLEAAIIHNQQVSGVSIDELRKAQQEDSVAISDIDVQGVDRLYSFSKSVIPIFVIPPNYIEWRERMRKRGHMTEEELSNRLNSAKAELAEAVSKDYYHFIINDDLQQAIKGLDKIANGQIDPEHEKQGKQAAAAILADLEAATS